MKFVNLAILMVLVSILTAGVALAETGTTQVTILNTAPSVDSVELNDAATGDEVIDLAAATTQTLTCSGLASDADGLTDITGVSAVIWSANSAMGSADDPTNHYTNASCNYNSGTGAFDCDFAVQFYADPAVWTCSVTATDASSDTGSLTDTATVNQLLALNIPDGTNIDFGSLAVGQNTALSSLNVTFENEGNIEIDVDVDAYETGGDQNSANSMTCTTGYLPVGNFRASLTQGAFATYTPMVQAGHQSFTGTNLARQTSGTTPTSDTLFFGLEVTSGVNGACTGVVSVQGTAS